MNQIRNEFSWSKSRDEIFQTCPRKYYFNYYGYWGGWQKGTPERIRQIYVLKNLKNRFMWAGQKVHDCIKHTLKNLQRGISILDVDEIVSITLEQMRDDFRSSRELSWPANETNHIQCMTGAIKNALLSLGFILFVYKSVAWIK